MRTMPTTLRAAMPVVFSRLAPSGAGVLDWVLLWN